MDAASFFGHLFGDSVSPSETISVWSLPSKVGKFYTEVGSAAKRVKEVCPREDTYFGCGLYRPGVKVGRGTAADVTCITALWADVDYGATHAKDGVPPNIIEAIDVIKRIGLKPSIVIDSGYGLHVYWLLTEALSVKDEAATISRRWGATVLECARCLGFVVDSVHDISRVMRVPGTFNYKHSARMPVQFLGHYSNTSLRYEITDIEEVLVDEAVSKTNLTATVHVAAVILNPKRSPSTTLIDAMCANDPKAKKTWERKRTDLTDQTPSSYDMALAHVGAQMDLDDQEIADMIIGWRTKHDANPAKAMRQSYIQNTIAKARLGRQKDKAIEKLASALVTPGENQEPTAKEKASMLETLSQTFGVKIARWIQHGTENAEYSLVLASGTDLLIGTAADVLKQSSFRVRLLESVGVILPQMKPRAWESVVTALTQLREVLSNPEGSRKGQVSDWLGSYLNSVSIEDSKVCSSLGAVIMDNRPLRKGSMIYIHAGHLMRHVMFAQQDRVGKRQLSGMLRVAGWERESLSGTVTNDSTGERVSVTRSYWKKKV